MSLKSQSYIDRLNKLDFSKMYGGDFFLTWEKTDEEIEAVFTVKIGEGVQYVITAGHQHSCILNLYNLHGRFLICFLVHCLMVFILSRLYYHY